MYEPILTQWEFLWEAEKQFWVTLSSSGWWVLPYKTQEKKASSPNLCWTPSGKQFLLEKTNLLKHTSSRISLFLCSSSGSSLISWSTVWMPPCSTTDVDLVNIDWGTVSPDTSSIAAGRLREANTLEKNEILCHLEV